MIRKSLSTSGSEYYKSSLQEIINVYEQCGNNADLTKNKLADKYQEKEVQTIIDSLEKIKNPDTRIESYRNKLKYLLWTVLSLTAIPVPFLFFSTDLSPLAFGFSTVIGLLPIIISIAIFYSKLPSMYYIILIIYVTLIVFFSPVYELIDGIFHFTFEPVFLIFFSLLIILIVSKVSVIFFSYKLLKMDDITTRYISKHIES